jgi:WD40 repeat protein
MGKAVDKMKTMRIHSDWITCLLYLGDLNRLVVGSLDGLVTMVNASNCTVDRVFGGTGVAVRLMAWSHTARCLVSACTDRSLVVWDPYTLQVAAKIDGLTAYVVSLSVNDDAQHIIVTMDDKTIRTWDCVTYDPLHVVYDTSTQLPLNTISAALWIPSLNVLYTAGSRLSAWLLERTSDSWMVTDDDDLCVTLFNSVFNQVITVTNGGVVCVYNLVDGLISSQFNIIQSFKTQEEQKKSVDNATGRRLPVVHIATFDYAQRRLMVVTGQRSEIQLWNFHNGQCVKTIHPRIPSTLYSVPTTSTMTAPDFRPYEISTLSYFLVYQGPSRNLKKFVTFGTDIGITSCLMETSEDIEEEPSYNLMKTSITGRKKVFLDTSGSIDGEIQRKSRAVQWMVESCENHILVAYRDGSMLHWDIDKSIPGAEIEPRRKDAGVQFIALKRRVVASRGHAITMSIKARKTSTVSLAKGGMSAENDSDFEDGNPEEDSDEDEDEDDVLTQFPGIPMQRAKTPDTPKKPSAPRSSSVVGGLGLSPRGSVSTASPRKLSVVYSQHLSSRSGEYKGDASNTTIPAANTVIRSAMPPAVVGVARGQGFNKSSLKPLIEDDDSVGSTASLSPRKSHLVGKSRTERMGRVSFASTHHLAVIEGEQTDSDDEELRNRANAVKASSLEETLPALVPGDPETGGDLMKTTEPMLRVYCAVVLKMTKIIIGNE